jgi:hypothetical protein
MSDGLMPSPECSGGTAGAKDPVEFLSFWEGMAFFSVRVAHVHLGPPVHSLILQLSKIQGIDIADPIHLPRNYLLRETTCRAPISKAFSPT